MTKIPTGQHNVMAKLAAGQRIHQNTSTNQYSVGSPQTSWVSIQRPTFTGLHSKGYLTIVATTTSAAGYVQSRDYGLSREGYRWCSAHLDWTIGPDASEQERAAHQVYLGMLDDLTDQDATSIPPSEHDKETQS